MDEIVDLVEQEVGLFVEIDTVDVGASDDAVLFDIGGELVQTDYAPGYVLHGGYMTVGTTKYAWKLLLQCNRATKPACRPLTNTIA